MRIRSASVILAVSVGLALSGCSLRPNDNTLPGQVAVGSDGYSIVAMFGSIENLVPNSTVQYNDVNVGTVAKISVVDWKAKVTLRLKKSLRLPANVTFKIGQKTLLGAQYVQIEDPAAPEGKLSAGQTLNVAQTDASPETEKVLSAVALLLNNGGLSQINTITSELNTALGGRETDARNVIGKLNTLLETLDSEKANVVQALESLDSLSKRLSAQKETVGEALDSLAPGIKVLNDERVKLVQAIEAVGQFGTVGTQLINTSQKALLGNLKSLRPVLEQLNAAGDNLPNALKYMITIPFPLMTTENAIKGDFANLFLTLDVSVQTLTASFLGTSLGRPALQSGDPLSGPLQLDPKLLESLPSLMSPSSPTPTTSPPTTGKGDAPSGTPTAAPCNFLTKVLGGC